jgi:hypothetical protein
MDESSLLDGMETEMDDEVLDGGEDGQGGATRSLQFQTLLAIQELGLVIGVALTVGILFMLMIYLEKGWNTLSEIYHKRFVEENEDDIEDPAALVGTFKRYKN